MASDRSVLDRITCRRVLNAMVILGFMLNYMLRVNLTIAIVSMVLPSNNGSQSTNVTLLGDESNATASSERVEAAKRPRYPWNEYQVNLVLGSFFWGYVCTELPGGRLAEIVGPKRVFGYSMLISSVVTLLTPLSAYYGYVAVVASRTVLGLMLGATWPAIQPMTARWIPPTERSKFVSNMMASSLGAAITMPVSGLLIASLGWESVFYVTGAVGIGWSAAWFLLIFDSPAQHPRISVEERRYIEEAIGSTSTTKRLPVPWKSIFLSAPVWAIVLTHGCNVFGYFTVVNQLPTYMKYILNFNIKQNGILSSLPYLGKYIFAVTTSSLADHLFKKGKLPVTSIRKIFTTFVGTMAASERDAGFCSGGDEDDMYDLHSPSASEDSLEVQVTPISSKNKRKLVEPRKIREPNSAPLKKRRFGGIEERTVPDAESSRMLESPSPFRPWSSADKRIDFKMSSISTETTTVSQPCVLALSPNASQRIDSPYRHHRHHRHSHRHHHRTSANKNDDDNEDVHDNVRRGSTDRGQGNTVDDTYIRAFDSDDDEEYESTTGDGFEKQDETQRRETLEARFRQSAPARSTRCEKREFFRQKTSVAIVPNANSTTMSDNAVSLDSVLSRTTHPRLQEEPLSLVLRADASARVPSHPAVNGTYEKTCAYTMERSNVSPAASSSPLSSSLSSLSSSSSSSASCSSASSSSSSSSSHRQQNHRSCSSGGDACSTAGTTTATITTTTTTTPTSTATNVPNNHTRQHASAGQQRNYKNMTRERRIEANARERTRVHTISAAFETLRRAIPAYSHNQKLSKLSVLRIACSYIMTLGKIVDTPQTDPTNGASLGACVDLVSRTIQTEGKLRKRKED